MKTIKESAFQDSIQIEELIIPSVEFWCAVEIGSHPFDYSEVETKLYVGNELITELIIPDTISSVPYIAFYNCDSLAKVIFADSVTSIGQKAFYSCSNLSEIVFSNNLKTIGANAFRACKKLTTLKFPKSISTIGREAFRYCSNLKKATFPVSNVNFGKFVFKNCSSSLVLYGITAYFVGDVYHQAKDDGAKYSILTSYTISYDLQGGKSDVKEEKKYHEYSTLITSTIPQKDGYKFLGWSKENNERIDYNAGDIYDIDESVTLYAVWKTKVKYDVNDDDLFNYADVKIIIDTVAGIDTSKYDILMADFDGDNYITLYDVNQLLLQIKSQGVE